MQNLLPLIPAHPEVPEEEVPQALAAVEAPQEAAPAAVRDRILRKVWSVEEGSFH